jgi:hypothetical protein
LVENASYFALRRRPGLAADAWWNAVLQRADVPHGLLTILAGRTRVELSRDDTIEALDWAEQRDGTTALAVYPFDPRTAIRISGPAT